MGYPNREEQAKALRKEGKTFTEIGAIMEVSRQRACQLASPKKTNKGMKYKKGVTILNGKQENYSLNILKGMGVREAAVAAGYITGSAGGLSGNPDIQARIKELRAGVVMGVYAELEERKEKLTEIVRMALPGMAFARDRIAAIAELNKMEGSYPPEKHAVVGKVIVEWEYVDRAKLIEGQSARDQG